MRRLAQYASVAGAVLLGASSLWAEPGKAPTETTLGEKGVLFEAKGDKSFKLRMHTLFQTSWTLNDAHGQGATWDSDTNNVTLDIARTEFEGHVVNPMYRYRVQLDWLRIGDSAPSAGNVGLLNIGWAGFAPSDSFGVYIGQDKVSGGMTFNTDEGQRQFKDMGVANRRYHNGYAKGIWVKGMPMLGGNQDGRGMQAFYSFGMYNGESSGPMDFRNSDNGALAFGRGLHMLYNIHLAFMPFGGAEEIMEAENDLRRQNDQMVMMIAGAANMFTDTASTRGLSNSSPLADRPFENSSSSSGSSSGTVGEADIRGGTADIYNMHLVVRFFYYGFSMNAGFIHNSVNFRDSDSNGDGIDDTPGSNLDLPNQMTNTAWFVSFGYAYVMTNGEIIEFAIRFEQDNRDEFRTAADANDSTGPDSNQIGTALSYYLAGRNLKITLGYTYTNRSWPLARPAGAIAADALASDLHTFGILVQLRF